MPDKLESTKPFDFRKLIELAYLMVILSAFSWAKEFLLPIVLAILIVLWPFHRLRYRS
jgi:hypothetical protein